MTTCCGGKLGADYFVANWEKRGPKNSAVKEEGKAPNVWSRGGFQVSRRKSRPVWGGFFVDGDSREQLLHLDGEGFGEFEAEGGLGRQDDLLFPGVGPPAVPLGHCFSDLA